MLLSTMGIKVISMFTGEIKWGGDRGFASTYNINIPIYLPHNFYFYVYLLHIKPFQWNEGIDGWMDGWMQMSEWKESEQSKRYAWVDITALGITGVFFLFSRSDIYLALLCFFSFLNTAVA